MKGAFAEILRVLKPGRKLCLFVTGRTSQNFEHYVSCAARSGSSASSEISAKPPAASERFTPSRLARERSGLSSTPTDASASAAIARVPEPKNFETEVSQSAGAPESEAAKIDSGEVSRASPPNWATDTVCVAAFGRSVPMAAIAVVYLTGSAIGSIIPTPGGIGGVEAALTAGLTAAGLPGAVAVSAVLLFRLLTFWLPVPFGWAALNFLEHQQDL